MKTTIGALLLAASAASAPAQDLGTVVLPASDPGGPRPAEALDLPAALDGATELRACPFRANDPLRLLHLLGVAGADAIRAEGPHRRAQARLCSP